MKNIVSIILILISIYIIWDLFKGNQDLRSDISVHQTLIDSKQDYINILESEVKLKDDSILVQNSIIDSLKQAYEAKKEVVIKYTEVEKKVYFDRYFEDSTQIILMNEERLFLIELSEIQSNKIILLETNIDSKDKIINAQKDIIKAQEVIIIDRQKENKKLRTENKLIKIGAVALLTIVAIL